MTALVVDLRRAFDSGLGTHIRTVVPGTLKRLGGIEAVGLIAPGDEARHLAYLGSGPGSPAIRLQPCAAAPLTLAEQLELRRLVPAGALLWATSIAHPLSARMRIVGTVHDVIQLARPAAAPSAFVRWASRAYFQNLRRHAALLLFSSTFTAAEFERVVGKPRGPSMVVPLGVDAAAWHAVPPKGAPERPYFLFIGNHREHKNLVTLLDAFEAVRATIPHELVLIGRAHGFRSGDDALAQRLARAPERVQVRGEVGNDELKRTLAGAAALVLPSLYEGFGLPVLEAMASGCPVLCSTAASLPEVAGDAARMFDPTDTGALAQALREAAAWTPAERNEWRRKGLARAALLSSDLTAQRTASALRPLLFGRP
jgi:glycosyltransferase involved in cell wall biosynthesis